MYGDKKENGTESTPHNGREAERCKEVKKRSPLLSFLINLDNDLPSYVEREYSWHPFV